MTEMPYEPPRADTFARLRAEKRPGLVTYTTAGDPDLPRSAEISEGARPRRRRRPRGRRAVLDPLADGPVIQRATERALAAGGSLRASLDDDRAGPRRRRGADRHLQLREPDAADGRSRRSRARRRDAGVDGVLALDLPIEEAGDFRETLAAAGIDTIFLLSPTTTDARIATGGGAGQRLPVRDFAARRHRRARRRSRPARRRWCGASARTRRCRSRSASASRGPSTSPRSARYADAAVVGSALVSVIAERGQRRRTLDRHGRGRTCGG